MKIFIQLPEELYKNNWQEKRVESQMKGRFNMCVFQYSGSQSGGQDPQGAARHREGSHEMPSKKAIKIYLYIIAFLTHYCTNSGYILS